MDTDNTLIRSGPCPTCNGAMLWTQNIWPIEPAETDDAGLQLKRAAYCCLNGHMLDPATTRQCPACGIHDTDIQERAQDQIRVKCNRCDTEFSVADA